MDRLERLAKWVAYHAHEGQFRRDGITPYVTHPEAVANAVSGKARAVAWMHDVLEDCPTYKKLDLLTLGLPEDVVEAVVCLTKTPGQDYDLYINQVKSNKLARVVKIADIEHNLSCNPNPNNIPKYQLALKVLKS